MDNPLIALQNWYYQYQLNILFTLAAVAIYYIFRRMIVPRLENLVERDKLHAKTLHSALFTFTVCASIVILAVVMVIWGFNITELLALSTGILAITGVALFATWSILSNITAFFILLANQSYRRGNFIRVFEGDNYMEGYISQINMFSTVLITETRETIIYPNNLLTARTILVNPRERGRNVGKTDDFKREPSALLEEKKDLT